MNIKHPTTLNDQPPSVEMVEYMRLKMGSPAFKTASAILGILVFGFLVLAIVAVFAGMMGGEAGFFILMLASFSAAVLLVAAKLTGNYVSEIKAWDDVTNDDVEFLTELAADTSSASPDVICYLNRASVGMKRTFVTYGEMMMIHREQNAWLEKNKKTNAHKQIESAVMTLGSACETSTKGAA